MDVLNEVTDYIYSRAKNNFFFCSFSEHWSAPSLVLFLDETIASYVRCARLKIMEEEQKKVDNNAFSGVPINILLD